MDHYELQFLYNTYYTGEYVRKVPSISSALFHRVCDEVEDHKFADRKIKLSNIKGKYEESDVRKIAKVIRRLRRDYQKHKKTNIKKC